MGRSEPGDYTVAWAPPDYTVDEAGKVVDGYQPPGVNNWGRWGEDDQLGTQNLIGPEQVAAAAALVRDGKTFSLALNIDAAAPRFPTRPPPLHWFVGTGSDGVTGSPVQAQLPGYQWNDDVFQMACQGSTQWDGFGHFMAHDTMYNGYWGGNVTSVGGARVLGIEHHKTSFIGRAVLLDLGRHLDHGEWVREQFEITPEILDGCIADQGMGLQQGDMLLLRTGFLKKWWGLETEAEKMEYFYDSPGLGGRCVEWLHERDISAVAADTIAVEVMQPTEPPSRILPVHHGCLIDLGLPLGEFWELEALADDCAADGRYEFMLVAPPLVLPGAVGSPLNPIAMK